MDANEFTHDRTIDPSQLDMECVRQADRFFAWAERAAEAGAEVDRTKLTMEVTQARLEIECRQTPEKFGLVKITEGGIKAAVIMSDRGNTSDGFFNDSAKLCVRGRVPRAVLLACANQLNSEPGREC